MASASAKSRAAVRWSFFSVARWASWGRSALAVGRWVVFHGRESIGEIAALNKLHGGVALTVMLPNFKDRHDSRVIQESNGLGLVLEPP